MISYLLELGTSWTFKPILLWSGRQWFGFIIIGSFFGHHLIFEILLLRLATTTNKKKRRTKDGGKKFKNERRYKKI